jgi:methanogenic corrinoid protein MtbC1
MGRKVVKMLDTEKIVQAMGDLEEDDLNEILEKLMAEGGKEAMAAMEAMQKGMDIVGQRFESGEYFVGDLIFAGEVMTGAMEIIKPALAKNSDYSLGKLIICTVKDDLHDIGKNIVKSILEAGGLEVVDLGIDTPYDKIIATAKEQNINIIVLSGVLTLALDSMKATVEAFKNAGIRNNVKILVGGNPVSEVNCVDIGADEWAHSPQKTLNVCKGWAQA